MSISKSIYKYILPVFALCCFISCEETDMKTDSFVHIYLAAPDNQNILSLNFFQNTNNNFDIFGICTVNEAVTKYDGNGKLYYLSVEKNGDYINHEIIKVSDNGFPANIIKSNENEYLTFWNNTKDTTQFVSIISVNNNMPALNNIDFNLKQVYRTNYVMGFCETLSGDGYILLVLSGDDKNVQTNTKKTRLIEIDKQFNIIRNIGEYEFKTENFGITGGLTLEFLKRINNFVYVRQDTVNNRYYFNSPIDNQITLMHIGDNVPIFQDENYWVAALQEIRPDTASVILNTPLLFDKKSYYIDELPLYPHRRTKNDFDNMPAIENIDISQRIYTGSAGNNQLIIATANSAQGIRYKVKNGEITEPLLFGKTYPYNVAGFISLNYENNIIILGTTKLANERQRVFLLKTDNK